MALLELSPRDCHTREDWSQLSHLWEFTVSSSATVLCMLSILHASVSPSFSADSFSKENTNSRPSLTPAPSSSTLCCLFPNSCAKYFAILSCSFLLWQDARIRLPIFQKWHPSKDDLAVVCISTSHMPCHIQNVAGHHSLCFQNQAGYSSIMMTFLFSFSWFLWQLLCPWYVLLEVTL